MLVFFALLGGPSSGQNPPAVAINRVAPAFHEVLRGFVGERFWLDAHNTKRERDRVMLFYPRQQEKVENVDFNWRLDVVGSDFVGFHHVDTKQQTYWPISTINVRVLPPK